MAKFDWSLPYSISRKFSFRWFTLFVAIEFVVAIVLFSLINLGSVGYDLVTIYSSDPNTTVSQADRSSIPAFLRSKSRPSCESVNLDVGRTFSTNNSALTYTLNAVDDGERTSASSLVYHNNMLDDCTISDILFIIESDTRTMAQRALKRWGVDLSAHIACTIASRSGPATLNLTATYNYMPPAVNIYDGFTAFPGRNATTQASLYWAEASLINYWYDLMEQFEGYSNNLTDRSLPKGALYFNASRSGIQDISSLKFFETLYRLAIANEDGVDRGSLYANGDSQDVADVATDLPFYTSADALAKLFHSTIFTDLGQVAYQPNIFADVQLLNLFSSNFTRVKIVAANDDLGFRVPAGPANSYDSLKSTTGPIGVNPSVISARYLCQVPRRKSTGNFLISILVADLVLLQALWIITIWMATKFVEHKDERANWCEGCVGAAKFGVGLGSDKDTDDFVQQDTRKRVSAVSSTQLHDAADSLMSGQELRAVGPTLEIWRH